jgi:flagellum-specific ATP synthase
MIPDWTAWVAQYQGRLRQAPSALVSGRLTRLVGLALEAVGCSVKMGDRCRIAMSDQYWAEAEVVGFDGDKVYLMPLESIEGVKPGARVEPIPDSNKLPVGEQLLGRVLGGQSTPLDSKPLGEIDDWMPLHGGSINPLHRAPITESLDVGVRAINALLTVGKGQRMGLFAGSGVGKSVLLGMMTRYTTADVIVVGLIGERGREVQEFIDHNLGAEGLARSVVVAAPADESPLLRLRAAYYATALAEYFRDQGKNVLLLMDSLTRFAQSQREIALAVGEPPATKGYPPSVFAKLPKLVERAGNGKPGSGSITAFYTVLTEGDDLQDPIADAARAILDGHVVLSRALAEEGHYPAVDVETSVSRAMQNIVPEQQMQQALLLRQLYSNYRQNQDLIQVGAYVQGSNPILDQALERLPMIQQFLKQGLTEQASMEASCQALSALLH